MAENEAIKNIQYRIYTAGSIVGNGNNGTAYEDLEMAIQALEEIQQYRAIGTIEEFKALKEKNLVKKPIWYGHHFCPNCDSIVYVNGGKDIYCPKCGQKLDWSE